MGKNKSKPEDEKLSMEHQQTQELERTKRISSAFKKHYPNRPK